jgi:hypothetical protein
MHMCLSGTCTEPDCCLGGHTGGAQWGDPAMATCMLTASWQELGRRGKDGSPSWRTGRLGALIVSPRYEVWLCEQGHPCGDGYDEQMEIFVPWGRNSQLQLV